MSSSTVSITAAAPTRRRTVLASEENPANEGGATTAAAGATSRDLSHHSVLERSTKELKKSANNVPVNGAVPQRRSRKHAAKPEKSRWLTIVSIVTKNLMLLIVLIGFVQMVRRFVMGSGDGGLMGFRDIEGRIAEVERFVKKTANSIQKQVDVVDREVKEGIVGLREELGRKIEDRSGALENNVRRVEARNEELGRIVTELRSGEFLTKGDLDKVLEELKKNVRDEVFGELSLDDVRMYVKGLVVNEIEKHAADGLGRVDYALGSGGATVVKHSEPYVPGKVGSWLLKSGRNGVHSDAVKMLKPSFGEPGQCFPLKGSSGFVQIRLRTAIVPEALTLEHVAKSVAYDRSSAPKECRVYGWLQGHDPELAVDEEKRFHLTDFTYDLEKSNAQTFNVLDSTGSVIIDTVRLNFTSNHGSPSHTCIYRFRVHGHEPESASMINMQS